MSDRVHRLIAELLALPTDERRAAYNALTQALRAETEAAVVEELDRRCEDLDSGRDPGVPMEDVFAELLPDES